MIPATGRKVKPLDVVVDGADTANGGPSLEGRLEPVLLGRTRHPVMRVFLPVSGRRFIRNPIVPTTSVLFSRYRALGLDALRCSDGLAKGVTRS
jgi:hypothetical protein